MEDTKGKKETKDPKLIITQKKYVAETMIISARLPRDLIADLDKAAKASRRTRNEIIMRSLEFSLNHMDIVID